MKEENFDLMLVLFLFIIGIVLGAIGTKVYDSFTNQRDYDGLWLNNYQNKSSVIAKAYEYEQNGEWVCLNIKGMKYQEVIDTCIHEASHELFAKECTQNVTKCMEIAEK